MARANLRREAHRRVEVSAAQAEANGHPRILIADHDPATRTLVECALRGADFHVTSASDGREALTQLSRTKFDLALLDIWMPRLNGLEILKALRKRKTPPKVIVITSDCNASTLIKAMNGRATRCVIKPIDPKALVATVRESLAMKSQPPRIEVISGTAEWVELRLPCTLEAAELIESFMNSLEADLSADTRASVGQVFHELLLNAIEWGGRLDPHRKVQVAFLRTRHMLLYRIADPGPGFRFSNLSHAAIAHEGAPTEHQDIRRRKGLRPGGFGLVLAKANADELLYNEAQNEVVFVKYLDMKPAETPQAK